jgi:hypothetical protein
LAIGAKQPPYVALISVSLSPQEFARLKAGRRKKEENASMNLVDRSFRRIMLPPSSGEKRKHL